MMSYDNSLDRLSIPVHITVSATGNVEALMKRIMIYTLLAALFATPVVHAEMTTDSARAAVAPFYQALNAEHAQDSADLVRQATAAEWVSCRGNEICNNRDEVIAGIGARLKSVPDLKWQIKDVLVSGDEVIVRGEATGTPSGEFFGAPHGGRSFRIMSVDVHTLRDGKMVRSYHVEDWIGAVRQLSTN
jgi:predicted ester cyclase